MAEDKRPDDLIVTIVCSLAALHEAERALSLRVENLLQTIDLGLPKEQFDVVNAKFERAADALAKIAHATVNNVGGRPGAGDVVQLTDVGKSRHQHLHPQRAFPVKQYTPHVDGRGWVAHVWYVGYNGMPAIQSLSHEEYERAR